MLPLNLYLLEEHKTTVSELLARYPAIIEMLRAQGELQAWLETPNLVVFSYVYRNRLLMTQEGRADLSELKEHTTFRDEEHLMQQIEWIPTPAQPIQLELPL